MNASGVILRILTAIAAFLGYVKGKADAGKEAEDARIYTNASNKKHWEGRAVPFRSRRDAVREWMRKRMQGKEDSGSF